MMGDNLGIGRDSYLAGVVTWIFRVVILAALFVGGSWALTSVWRWLGFI